MADTPDAAEFSRRMAETVVVEVLDGRGIHDDELAEEIVGALVDEQHLVTSDRWDEECHGCEARIGDHFVDGRCPGPPLSDMDGWAQDDNGVWHQVVSAHGPAEHRHPAVALCGHAIPEGAERFDYRWRPGANDKWCLMPRCRVDVPT